MLDNIMPVKNTGSLIKGLIRALFPSVYKVASFAQREFLKYSDALLIRKLRGELGYRIELQYNPTPSDTLSILCDLYGSDKGEAQKIAQPYPWESHTYSHYVTRLFGHCRRSVLKVFECGIGTNNPELPSSMGTSGIPGASLRVWRDYFPSAHIFGGDIDEKILFTDDRIKTYKLDQTDPSSVAEVFRIVGGDFDLIVDDGLHTFDAGKTFFDTAFNFLSDTGVYIIEDVSANDCVRFSHFLKERGHYFEIVNLFRKGIPLQDNSLVVIRKGI